MVTFDEFMKERQSTLILPDFIQFHFIFRRMQQSLCSKESQGVCQLASIFEVVFLFSNIVGSTVTNNSENFKRT